MKNWKEFYSQECLLVAESWKRDIGHPDSLETLCKHVTNKYNSGFLEAIIRHGSLFFWFDFSVHSVEGYKKYKEDKVFDPTPVENPEILFIDNVVSKLDPKSTVKLMRRVIKLILKKYPSIKIGKRTILKKNGKESTLDLNLHRKEKK